MLAVVLRLISGKTCTSKLAHSGVTSVRITMGGNILQIRFILLILLCIWVKPSFSHPHVFIDYIVDLSFDSSGLDKIGITWKFDDMYSTAIMHVYDENKDHRFDSVETITIIDKMLPDIKKKYHYFSYIEVDRKVFNFESITDFNAVIQDEMVVEFSFNIPCPVKTASTTREVRFTAYDETYYIDFDLNNVNVKEDANAAAFNYKVKVSGNQNKDYYYGQ